MQLPVTPELPLPEVGSQCCVKLAKGVALLGVWPGAGRLESGSLGAMWPEPPFLGCVEIHEGRLPLPRSLWLG